MTEHAEPAIQEDPFEGFSIRYRHSADGSQTVLDLPVRSIDGIAEVALPDILQATEASGRSTAVDPKERFSSLSARFSPVVHVHKLSDAELTSDDDRRMAENPIAQAYLRYMYASRKTWQDAFKRGESALLSSREDYLQTARQPGTYLIEVLGEGLLLRNGKEEQHTFGLGYALLTTEREGISDLEDFPEAIQNIQNLARLREVLNVSHFSGIDFPEGQLMGLLFEQMLEITKEQPIVTRIVIGEFLDGSTEMTKCNRNLRSIASMSGSGFGYYIPEGLSVPNLETNLDADVTFNPAQHIAIKTELPAHPGVRDVAIPITVVDAVFLLEPGKVSQRQAQRTEKRLNIRRDIWEKISIGTSFAKGGSVAIWSDSYNSNLDVAFAEQQDGNNAYIVHSESAWRDVYRQNLFHRTAASDGSAFAAGTLNGILSLNMLRQMAATGDGDVLQKSAFAFVRKQVEQLRLYGHYAGREVLIPDDWPPEVVITLDKKSSDNFKRYAQEAYGGRGCQCEELDPIDGRSRFLLPTSEALKFSLLVNPYQANETDFLREKDLPPPLFTETDYIRLLRKFNVRVDSAHPVYTDFVQDTFLKGAVAFETPAGNPLPLPPNQFEVIGQKVAPDDGVVVEEATGLSVAEPEYLKRTIYKYTGSDQPRNGTIYREFITRGGSKVMGIFPLARINGELAIPLRENHQRPIPNALFSVQRSADGDARPRDVSLDRTRRSGYGMEALAITKEEAMESPEVVATRGFHKFALTPMAEIPLAANLKKCTTGPTFPSSSGIHEEWHDVVVPTDEATFLSTIEGAHTKFKTPTRVRHVLLNDIVSVGESSGPLSSPLLRVAYRELLNAGEVLPPWGGPRVTLADQHVNTIAIHELQDLHHGHERQVQTNWVEVPLEELPADYKAFYDIRVGNYFERDGQGNVITKNGVPITRRLESATLAEETNLSNNTIVFLPCAQVNGETLVFLETREQDLPLISFRTGLAKPEVVPAFRVDLDTALLDPVTAEKQMIQKFETNEAITVKRKPNGDYKVWTLAPELQVSAGVVPERAYLRLLEIDAQTIAKSNLRAYRLTDLAMATEELFCGHSINSVLRGAHALGAFEKSS